MWPESGRLAIEEVANCKLLGEIVAHPPYIWPGDDVKQLRRKAAELGADTILIPGRRSGRWKGSRISVREVTACLHAASG
jgi:hypothetical protein